MMSFYLFDIFLSILISFYLSGCLFILFDIHFCRTGKPEIDMGEEVPSFTWDPVNAENISHLDIGNVMEMDQGLPNHRYQQD